MTRHTVEIHLNEFRSVAEPVQTNDVAVVVPAVQGVSAEDEVVFVNHTADEIELWFPRRWSSDLPKPGATLKLASGQASDVFCVDAMDPGEVQYQVYAHAINEFAVGDSPPRMKLPPPGP